MPELPEVETIAESLRRAAEGGLPLVGETLLGATLRWPRHIAQPGPAEFASRVQGQRVRGVGRRGKFLTLDLDRDTLLIHLRMSGDLRMTPSGAPLEKHDLTLLHTAAGHDLRFNDPRRFGRVWLLEDPQAVLGRLGPEPLEAGFTAAAFAEQLARHRRQLKPLLLDQTFLAGVGNIYADEALHRARLHPLRRSDRVSPQEAHRLWRGLRAALRSGLHHHGASIDWVYRGGGFQNHFRVYARTGEPCPVCATPIRRIRVGQRSTHFCPSCQPLRPRPARPSGGRNVAGARGANPAPTRRGRRHGPARYGARQAQEKRRPPSVKTG
jgi:formamidopyrimidine-DNA glycosylase